MRKVPPLVKKGEKHVYYRGNGLTPNNNNDSGAALEIISHCEQVLKKRFLVDQGVFGVKKVDKEGVGVVRDTNGVLVA